MFNFAEIIVAVVVTVINVVNTIVQTATGGQGNLAETFQSFTNTVNAAVGGEVDDNDDDMPDQTGPSPEELRRLEQERQAREFDKDIDRLSDRDDLQDGDDSETVLMTHQVELRQDIASLLHGVITPVKLQNAAEGNPVAQALLQMLRHERSHLDRIMQAAQTVEQGIVSHFGLAEEDTFETAEAARIYEQAKAYSIDDNLHLPIRLMTPEQIDLLMASDESFALGLINDPQTSNFFQTESTPFADPCADSGDPRQCYVDQLARIGVSLISDQDLVQVGELSGITLLEFSDEQLAVVLQGVQQTAEQLALTINDIPMIADQPGQWLTPEEAFISTFGSIKFGYDPDHPLYPESGRTIAFDVLPDSFVVVHELGHAFHRRYGGNSDYGYERIAGTVYVKATGGAWYPDPLGVETTDSQILGYSLERFKKNGQEQTDDDGNPLYFIPPGLYVPGERSTLQASGFFPNELREKGPNPSEGFADTFANFILNPDVLPPRRRAYFDEKMAYWLYRLASRRRSQ